MPPRDPNEFIGANLERTPEVAPITVDPNQFTGSSLGVEAPIDEEGSGLKKAAIATGAGAGLGVGSYLMRGMLRRAFPGMPGMAKTSALKRIDSAIRQADSDSGLKQMMGEYMREVSTSGKPLTFADFMAQKPGHHPAVATIKELIGQSGNIPKIEEKLTGRALESRQRVLNDVATAMGVTPQSISEGLGKLKESKYARSAPLYEEAFKDKGPIRDTKLMELFGTETPNMSMMNALKGRMKTLALQGKEPSTLMAADPARRDAWKRLLTTEVPEQMFAGEEWSKLREFYSPSIEDLHHMRGNLWDEYSKAKRAGDNEVAKAYKDSWVKVTKYLDEGTSGAYRKARETYKGDSDLESAFQTGAELLTMKPDEIRVAIKGMGDDQRQALAMGFYGGLDDMKQQTFIREFVRRPDLYPERQAQLSTVFRDPVKLDQFLKNLEGEQAMSDSANVFSHAPLSKDPLPRTPYFRIRQPLEPGAGPSDLQASLWQYINPASYVGWPSRSASRAGTDFLFREPSSVGRNVSHPDWGRVEDTPLSGLEIAKQGSRWSGLGGAGGLGIYGATRVPELLEDRQ